MKLATFDAGAGPQPGAVDVDRQTIAALDDFRSALEVKADRIYNAVSAGQRVCD